MIMNGKDLDKDDHDLFEGPVPPFAWRD